MKHWSALVRQAMLSPIDNALIPPVSFSYEMGPKEVDHDYIRKALYKIYHDLPLGAVILGITTNALGQTILNYRRRIPKGIGRRKGCR